VAGKRNENREIGLKSIQDARAARARSKVGRISGPTWTVGLGVLLLAMLVGWIVSARSLAHAKENLLAEQRAAVKTVGAEWYPLRDKIEKLTLEAAGPYKGDFVDPSVATWDFRSLPGIYLRLRIEDAKDVETLRKSAQDSVKDAFTSCLLRETSAAHKDDNLDENATPDQPWNLRQAYAATRVLSDDWAREVRDASDKIRLRVFEQQYDQAKRVGIPTAIDILTRAQFYLLVLDEDAPEAKKSATDGGPITSDDLQQVPHPARVSVMNLKTGAELVRLRRTGEADFRFVGGTAVSDPEMQAAMRRQVNNCALANEVWSAIR